MMYLHSGLDWFRQQSRNRKISLLSGLLMIAVMSLLSVWWVLSPDYGVLFNQLDSRDASQIISRLDEAGIPYQLRNQGRDILVNKAQVDKTRIMLMGHDLSLNNSIGFELFDKTDFGMTDFSQKINYQRALQGELERTINSLDEVRQARVQLVIPETHLFQQESNQPRVAVTLHLKHPLGPQQIKSIQQLISASVANLPLANIVIVDQNGNGLTTSEDDSSSAHFAAKKRVERYLTDKVMPMLNRVFPEGDVLVKIDASLNYDELQREREQPQQTGLITHEKETQHSSTSKNDKNPVRQDVTREKTYELGHEKERFIKASGSIERLTISVVLPRNTDEATRQQIERLVKSVVGFNEQRGDSISLEALIVRPTDDFVPTAGVNPPQSEKQMTPLFHLGLPVFLLLPVAYAMNRRARLKRRQQLLIELNQWLIEHV
ncbi:flagellar basal-body MS-ring/collar protein FliF [Legionella sp. CNM-4043-24]|uniref:flagellar basal-body MS-ring/collar protein FliF n=1 Tax=Legionella sp. CNM-4043-24 TaxID=3421646 RepID=UPI00403AA8F7